MKNFKEKFGEEEIDLEDSVEEFNRKRYSIKEIETIERVPGAFYK